MGRREPTDVGAGSRSYTMNQSAWFLDLINYSFLVFNTCTIVVVDIEHKGDIYHRAIGAIR